MEMHSRKKNRFVLKYNVVVLTCCYYYYKIVFAFEVDEFLKIIEYYFD